jgi:hypothetical protein
MSFANTPPGEAAQSRLGTRGTTTYMQAETMTPTAGYFAILCK